MIEAIVAAWRAPAPEQKCELVAGLTLPDGEFCWEPCASLGLEPGRPPQPLLVHPREVPRRSLGSIEGRAALIHAVAHIEFNAINLALDAILRFGGMPEQYYRDWLSVAQDEARHFLLLRGRLHDLGYSYGAFSAHNGLWEAAQKTADDVLARMALVPRVLEARGLDVTPGLIHRLKETGDTATEAVLRVILDEEVRHVAIGSHWYASLCESRGLPRRETFRRLLAQHRMRVRPPINHQARSAAGFDEDELAALLEPDAADV